MCRFIRLAIFIFCIFFAGMAWAATTLSVNFTGLPKNPDIQKNVRLALQNKENDIIKPITSEGVGAFYREAPKAIEQALQPYGYFHPLIRKHRLKKGNQWVVTFNINMGAPIRISRVDLKIIGSGVNDSHFQRLYKHLPIKTGDIFSTSEYEKAKQLLYDMASTRGYFDAKMLENKIFINLRTNQARILLKFETGPRYRFGDTIFSNSPFGHSFLMRFLKYKQGQKYNYHKIEKTQQDFIASNYFSQVVVRSKPKEAKNKEVPVHIKIVPRKRFSYILGAGYGTDTGPRGTLGFEMRRVNRHGHQFQSLMQISQYNSNAYATYFIPGGNPATDVWALTTGYANFNQVTGNGKSYKAEGSYTTALGDWKQTIALTYLDENYSIVGFQETRTKTLYPNIHWNYLSTRDNLYPKHGFSINLSLAAAPQYGISKNSFAQGRLDFKSLVTFFNSTRLILRTSLGRTKIKDTGTLPFSLQFFIGGARSLRGYSYNQIGPGKNLFIGSVEVQQRIFGNFYLVGLFDAGNVTNGSPFAHLNEGVGPGIAWLSPLGVFELTVARAITQPNKPWKIQFSMGPVL